MKNKKTIALILTRIGKRKREDTRKTELRIQDVVGCSFMTAQWFHEAALDVIHKEKIDARLTSYVS